MALAVSGSSSSSPTATAELSPVAPGLFLLDGQGRLRVRAGPVTVLAGGPGRPSVPGDLVVDHITDPAAAEVLRAGLGGRIADGRLGDGGHLAVLPVLDGDGRVEAVIGVQNPSAGDPHLLMEMSPDPVCLCREGDIVHANAPAELFFAGGGLTGRPVASLVHEDYQVLLEADAEALREEAGPVPMKCRLLDGGVREVEVIAGPAGARPGVLLTFRDVTGRNRALRDLVERESRLIGILDAVPDAIITLDRDGVIESVNPAAERIFGWPADAVVGRPMTELFDPGHRAAFKSHFLAHMAGTAVAMRELVGRRRDGDTMPVELSISDLHWAMGQLHAAVVRDITERKRMESHLVHIATHDRLTGLPNRAQFLDRLDQALAIAGPQKLSVAVFLLGIDDFKVINDSLGHEAGDNLLVSVGARLAGQAAQADTIARLGGDEFALFVTGMPDTDAVAQFARDLSALLTRPFQLAEREIVVGASIGISLSPRDGRDSQTLLKHADAAMHRSKQEGKSGFQFFDAGITAAATERLTLEHELRRAIENDDLVLHYQPQIEIATGHMVGVEALVRWQHAERGLVPPGAFIPLAEQTGLIRPLGDWVLRAACVQARQWQDAGLPPLRVSVNLSGHQAHDPALVAKVAEVLAQTGLAATWLDLELTESLLMHDAEATVGILQQLKKLGLSLALDDFGTGYSSLSYLKRFPFDTIKIDRAFVRDLPEGGEDEAIVQAIVSLAHSLGMSALAEGVETIDQLDRLRRHGCDRVQGFLFARPVPGDQVPALCQRANSEPF